MKIINNRTCRICSGDKFKTVIDFGENPLVNSLLEKEDLGKEKTYPLVVEQCQKCFLVQIVNPVSSKEIYQDQDYLYYTGDMPQRSQYMLAFNGLVADIERMTNPGDFIVEIGSNDGTVLRKFKERKILGVDPSTNVAIRAIARGVPTISAPFNERTAINIAKEFGQAKVIGGANCLAHIDDIHSVMKGVKALLAKDGIFWVECNYWVGMVKEKHYALIYHDHYSYFSLKNWVDLARMYGMNVFDAYVTEAQGEGLSLRLYIGYDRIPSDRFSALLVEDMGYNNYKTAQRYRKDVLKEAEKLSNLVTGLKGTVAGYGAAAKGFSILKLAGLDGRHIKFLVDDSPAKQGKYSPITHIPIISRAEADKQLPDYFIILAPNYAQLIMEKEKDSEFRRRGGKFIVPIGDIDVV
ncbi:MAG: class I SAM-dependent methyltransferase [bacterium]|nr:class I SAM-dependent methyltransferase [bacterium]